MAVPKLFRTFQCCYMHVYIPLDIYLSTSMNSMRVNKAAKMMGPLRGMAQTHRSNTQRTTRGTRRGKKKKKSLHAAKKWGPKRRRSEQANKQVVLFFSGSCHACILNGALQHKQAARSLIASPPGQESPEKLYAQQRQRYLHEPPQLRRNKNKPDR